MLSEALKSNIWTPGSYCALFPSAPYCGKVTHSCLLQGLKLGTEWKILMKLEKFVGQSGCISSLGSGIIIYTFAWYQPTWWLFNLAQDVQCKVVEMSKGPQARPVNPQPRQKELNLLQPNLTLHLGAQQDFKADQNPKHLQLQLLQTSTLFNNTKKRGIHTIKTEKRQTKCTKLCQEHCRTSGSCCLAQTLADKS